MNQDQFNTISELMASDLVHDLNSRMKTLYEKFGNEAVNACFGNALAIATGNILSAYCFGCMPDRKEAFKLFETVMKGSAKKHKEWVVSKSH